MDIGMAYFLGVLTGISAMAIIIGVYELLYKKKD